MDLTVTAAAILERLLNRSQVPNIRDESYWLVEKGTEGTLGVYRLCPPKKGRYLSPKETYRKANLAGDETGISYGRLDELGDSSISG